MLPRTMSASVASRCCPASSNRRERASAAVMKRARNLHRSSSIVASSSSPSSTSAASPRPSSPPPPDPSVDARARHNAEQASIFDSAVEAFVETPAEVLPVRGRQECHSIETKPDLDLGPSLSCSLPHADLRPPPLSLSHPLPPSLSLSLPLDPRNDSASSASPRPPARRSPRPSGTSRTLPCTRRGCSTSGPGLGA